MDSGLERKAGALMAAGYGYRRIAEALGLPVNTVKSWCRRHRNTETAGAGQVDAETGGADAEAAMPPEHAAMPAAGGVPVLCPSCGALVPQTRGRKTKRFCSDACRMRWWNAHPEEIRHRTVREVECAHCGKAFDAYGGARRRYCCRACYFADRYGKEDEE